MAERRRPEPRGITKLGRPTAVPYDNPSASILETFPNPATGSPWAVGLECEEFTSLCPVTGQPDFGRLRIHYVPAERCVESKSLKLYLGAYRNHGAFHEECVNRVADDLEAVLAPRFLRVLGDFRPRGGIAIRPVALRFAAGASQEERDRCLLLVAHCDARG